MIFGLLALVLVLPSLTALLAGSVGVGAFFLLLGGPAAYVCFKNFRNYERKYMHKIVLSVASGEVAAFETTNEELATKIETGLTQAIVHRG